MSKKSIFGRQFLIKSAYVKMEFSPGLVANLDRGLFRGQALASFTRVRVSFFEDNFFHQIRFFIVAVAFRLVNRFFQSLATTCIFCTVCSNFHRASKTPWLPAGGSHKASNWPPGVAGSNVSA